MPVRVRLLILETDQPLSPINSSRGGYGNLFQQLFSSVGSDLDPAIDVHVTPCYVVGNNDSSSEEDGSLPDISTLNNYDGVVITGSKYDAHGDNPWILRLIKWIQGPPSIQNRHDNTNTAKHQMHGEPTPTSVSPASASDTRSSPAPSALEYPPARVAGS